MKKGVHSGWLNTAFMSASHWNQASLCSPLAQSPKMERPVTAYSCQKVLHLILDVF